MVIFALIIALVSLVLAIWAVWASWQNTKTNEVLLQMSDGILENAKHINEIIDKMLIITKTLNE